MKKLLPCLIGLWALAGCSQTINENKEKAMPAKGTYAYDSAFLKANTSSVYELKSSDRQARVLLSADYQGRVMTSTATGASGNSYGWLNYDLIESGEWNKQFNPVGGEERFWLGPEGGQFSIYFNEGAEFDISNWQVPGVIDTVAYPIVSANDTEVVFGTTAMLVNYSGAEFDLAIERSVRLLSKEALATSLGVTWGESLKWVAYETTNSITNKGANQWTKDTGLLSIWLLGMMTPSPETTVIIPFRRVEGAKEYITDDYFGEIPAERLTVIDSVIYFQCDGLYRSKLGLSPVIAKPMAASFDFAKNTLTIIKFPVEPNGTYVNSKWEMQDEPYKGDVVNSYNDGPMADGSQMGPFYEIESSSPAKELAPGETQEHKQLTCHFEGEFESLNELSKRLLGVDLNDIKSKKTTL
ncbi:MAG: hypothetical protein RIF36_14615 [Imperialibacter sp.]|uniref:DUF6786 family protein n=1 Tax=Imperialibacter sp. TaxID=2038411 RepID=UPI0032EFE98C